MDQSKKKRKLSAAPDDNSKRAKMADSASSDDATRPNVTTEEPEVQPESSSRELPKRVKSTQAKGKGKEKSDASRQKIPRHRINKLVPPRPFPTVPTSVSATGPRSSHREGKNMICLTRKSSLSSYMRRCKEVIINDGYKTLHLSAMGAAIPILMQLVTALPPILPFAKDEISCEIKTRTVEVQDEILPDDEDEDISYQTRGKSVLDVVFKIGDGEFEGDRGAIRRYSAGKSVGKSFPPRNNTNKNGVTKKGKAKEVKSTIVLEEPEQEYMDML